MSNLEAFASILIAAVSADGILKPSEALSLESHLKAQSQFRNVDIATMTKSNLDKIKSQGIDDVISNAILSLSQEQQEASFAIAVDLAHSDQVLCEKEKLFLRNLAEKINISEKKADFFIEAIKALRRDNFPLSE